MMGFHTLLITLFFSSVYSSGAGIMTRSVAYGSSSNQDYFFDSSRTKDGGYISIGMTNSYGSGANDFFIVNSNSDLTLNFSLAIGSTGAERGYDALQTSDLGFLFAGSDWGDDTGILIKIFPNKTIEWSIKVSLGCTGGIGFNTLLLYDNGEFLALGHHGCDGGGIAVTKFSSKGELLWLKGLSMFSGKYETQENSLLLSDGGFVSSLYVEDDKGAWLGGVSRFDSAGAVLWTRYFNESADVTDASIYSIYEASNGDFLLSGFRNVGSTSESYIIRITSSGTLVFANSYTGNGFGAEGKSIIETSDGSIVIAGTVKLASTGAFNQLILKLSSTGDLIWGRQGASSTAAPDNALNVYEIDNGFGIAGHGRGLTPYNKFSGIISIVDKMGLGCNWTDIGGSMKTNIPINLVSVSSTTNITMGQTVNVFNAVVTTINPEVIVFCEGCNSGYFDSDCSLYECDGTWSNETLCNGRGTCEESGGTCNCNSGYDGPQCSSIISQGYIKSVLCGGLLMFLFLIF